MSTPIPQGRIGWLAAGFTPIRSNSAGLLPLPGDGRYEWGGYLDRDLLPPEVDPARGYIATANQMNLPEGFPYAQRRISFTWIEDTRFRRGSLSKQGLQSPNWRFVSDGFRCGSVGQLGGGQCARAIWRPLKPALPRFIPFMALGTIFPPAL
jgi:hypothetical protein